MPNTANAKWTGSIREGAGKVRLGGGAFEGDYSYKSRFEDGEGTNPEELIGAAEAACFSMAVTSALNSAGVESESVETTATVTLRFVDKAPTVTRIALESTVTAPGADEAAVREAAEGAKQQCPISRALAAVPEITLDLTVTT